MPLYEYRCDGCGARFEALVPAGRADRTACTSCGEAGRVHRLLSVFSAPRASGSAWGSGGGAAMPAGGGCCGGGCGHC